MTTPTAYGPHEFTIMEMGEKTSAPYCSVCGLEEGDGTAGHYEPPARHALPVPWTDAVGTLDVDTLRKLAPEVRTGLIDALRHATHLSRSARGSVVVEEDTYDLVRRVTAAEEVLRQWAQAFTAAAAECVAIAEEEALTAMGPRPGIEEAPSGSLFVPDGDGQRIKVEPQWKAGDTTWDVDTLSAWVAEQVISAEGVGLETEVAVFTAQEAVSLVRDGIDKLRRLGRYTPAASLIEAERKRLAGLQRDGDAAVLRQVRTVGDRRYQGVKVTREDTK